MSVYLLTCTILLQYRPTKAYYSDMHWVRIAARRFMLFRLGDTSQMVGKLIPKYQLEKTVQNKKTYKIALDQTSKNLKEQK